jgi:hemolysin III
MALFYSFYFSTLYHGFSIHKQKTHLKSLITSVFISWYGTYTPFLLMYMLNSFGITLLSVLWRPHCSRVNLYDFFIGKWVFKLIYIGMGCIMVVGGRTFFSIPSNILTMILIGASLYLIELLFFYLWKKYRYNHAIWHFFCTRSCCLSLRRYFIGGRVEVINK